MSMSFHIIVAVDQRQGIGKAGTLPWHLPGELRHFKAVTSADSGPDRRNVVIMGRRTWESLPERFRPLPGRINCVLTRQTGYVLPPGVLRAGSLDAALALCAGLTAPGAGRVFVIGGAQIFAEAFRHPLCRRVYWTQIAADYDCDTFLAVDRQCLREVAPALSQTEQGIAYSFHEFEILNASA